MVFGIERITPTDHAIPTGTDRVFAVIALECWAGGTIRP